MRRQILLIDVAIALSITIVAVIVLPGVAIVAILALAVLAVCAISFLFDGWRARRKGRPPVVRP